MLEGVVQGDKKSVYTCFLYCNQVNRDLLITLYKKQHQNRQPWSLNKYYVNLFYSRRAFIFPYSEMPVERADKEWCMYVCMILCQAVKYVMSAPFQGNLRFNRPFYRSHEKLGLAPTLLNSASSIACNYRFVRVTMWSVLPAVFGHETALLN